jgi:hypothetical protein
LVDVGNLSEWNILKRVSMGCFRIALLAALFVIAGFGQSSAKVPPRFEDYAATAYTGAIAPARIVTPGQNKYRTRIRDGMEKGPNFAGDMIVTQWGCGAPCLMMAMVSARTGEVHRLPLALENGFALPLLRIGLTVGSNPEVEFRQNSRLLILSATPNWLRENHRAWKHYFIWENNRWVLLYRELLLK